MRTSGGLPHRVRVRLASWHYSNSAIYYFTICSYLRKCSFGTVRDEEVELSKLGKLIEGQWLLTPSVRPGVLIDEYKIMPNHMHGLVFLPGVGTRRARPALSCSIDDRQWAQPSRPERSLGSLLGGFKSAVTSAARTMSGNPRLEVWQPRFHDPFVRNDRDLERIRKYIRENPSRWAFDHENPAMRAWDAQSASCTLVSIA